MLTLVSWQIFCSYRNEVNNSANVCNFTLCNPLNTDAMKTKLLYMILAVVLLGSCSTAYQSGQTPDDVYYSPAREGMSKRDEERAREEQERYEEYVSSQDDRYLRMKVANRSRWGGIDDFDYWYDSRYYWSSYNPYNNWNYYDWNNRWNLSLGYGAWRPHPLYGGGWNSYYGGGWGWNYPGYTVIAYSSPKFYSGYTSGSNLNAYRNKSLLNSNSGYYDPKTGTFVNANVGGNNGFGSLMRRVFSSSGSANNTGGVERAVRSFNNNNSSTTRQPSSNAGGNSGGVKSTGSSTNTGRGGRGN